MEYRLLRNQELKVAIRDLRVKCEKILGTGFFPCFTLHDVSHSDNLVNLVDTLTTSLAPQLTEQEAFILYSACYLHDIALQYPRCGETQVIRQNVPRWGEIKDESEIRRVLREHHHEIASEMIKFSVVPGQAQPYLDLPSRLIAEADRVAALCEGHCLDCKGKDKGRYDALLPSTPGIRLRLLSGLLRFADILDEQRKRVVIERIKGLGPGEVSLMHWWRTYYTEKIDIRHDENNIAKITVCFQLPFTSYEAYKSIIPNLQYPSIVKEYERHAVEFGRAKLICEFEWHSEPASGIPEVPSNVFDLMKAEAEKHISFPVVVSKTIYCDSLPTDLSCSSSKSDFGNHAKPSKSEYSGDVTVSRNPKSCTGGLHRSYYVLIIFSLIAVILSFFFYIMFRGTSLVHSPESHYSNRSMISNSESEGDISTRHLTKARKRVISERPAVRLRLQEAAALLDKGKPSFEDMQLAEIMLLFQWCQAYFGKCDTKAVLTGYKNINPDWDRFNEPLLTHATARVIGLQHKIAPNNSLHGLLSQLKPQSSDAQLSDAFHLANEFVPYVRVEDGIVSLQKRLQRDETTGGEFAGGMLPYLACELPPNELLQIKNAIEANNMQLLGHDRLLSLAILGNTTEIEEIIKTPMPNLNYCEWVIPYAIRGDSETIFRTIPKLKFSAEEDTKYGLSAMHLLAAWYLIDAGHPDHAREHLNQLAADHMSCLFRGSTKIYGPFAALDSRNHDGFDLLFTLCGRLGDYAMLQDAISKHKFSLAGSNQIQTRQLRLLQLRARLCYVDGLLMDIATADIAQNLDVIQSGTN